MEHQTENVIDRSETSSSDRGRVGHKEKDLNRVETAFSAAQEEGYEVTFKTWIVVSVNSSIFNAGFAPEALFTTQPIFPPLATPLTTYRYAS